MRHAEGFPAALGQALARADAPPTDGGRMWLDLGSGGGVPGLVLASLREEISAELPGAGLCEGVLLEASGRRAELLADAVDLLDLGERCRVVHARAEAAARSELRGRCSVVWSRSFGSPATTAECAAGFLGVGGWLVVSEPPAGSEQRWPAGPLGELGLEPVMSAAVSGFHYQVLRLARPCPERFPRRDGVPSKRPLY